MVWPAVIAAGASLVGGLMNKKASDNAAAQAAESSSQNMAMQREFAQNGIRWRVEDAKAAGIHPLFALGAQLPTYSPTSSVFSPDYSMGNAVASMGQDISRAVHSTRTQEERISSFQQMSEALALQRARLENESLRVGIENQKIDRSRALARDVIESQLAASQIAKLKQTQSPPMPGLNQPASLAFDGSQGSTNGLVETVPMRRNAVGPAGPWSESGAVSSIGHARTGTGWSVVPSMDVKQRIEDMPLMELEWMLKNKMAPLFGVNRNPPPFPPPKGKVWRFDWWSEEWRPAPAVEYRDGGRSVRGYLK